MSVYASVRVHVLVLGHAIMCEVLHAKLCCLCLRQAQQPCKLPHLCQLPHVVMMRKPLRSRTQYVQPTCSAVLS